VEEIIAEFIAKSGSNQRPVSDEEILERLLYPMVNEGAKILDEKIAQRASDIDIVWLNGYGWPAYTGGPMFWADTVGLDKIAESLAKHGFAVAPLLKAKAEQGGKFN
jgi:3-hydroxyacyl-CoA dehydrogenase